MQESVARQQAAVERSQAAAAATRKGMGAVQDSAITRQMESIRKQAGVIGQSSNDRFFSIPWPRQAGERASVLPPPSPVVYAPMLACDPLPADKLDPLVKSGAQTSSLSENLVKAVIDQESARHPCAVSPAGALGLMQLMPDTAAFLQVADPFDPQENVMGGTKYLRMLLDRYGGDLRKALSAYNAGPSRVDAVDGIPEIPETKNYVEQILKKINMPVQ